MRSSSSKPVSQTRRHWRYRPELIALEARLVPGESLLSAALSAAWLTAATPAATVRSAERSADAGSLALLDDAPAAALPRISAAVTGPTSETIARPVSAGTGSHDGMDLPDMTSALQHAALGAGSSFASQGVMPLTGESLQTAPDIGSFAARGAFFAGHAEAESRLELLAAGLRGPATTSAASVPTTAVTPQRAAAVRQQMAQLPLSFEANQGQADPSVRFLSHGQGYSLYLTATEAVVVLSQPAPAATSAFSPADALRPERLAAPVTAAPVESRVVRFGLEGGNPNAEVRGVEPLPGKVNYFLGNDHSKWTTNIATYGKVAYAGVYPGVDLVYYGTGRQLEYDFVVAAGADPSQVRLHVEGADRLEVDGDGALVVHAGGLELRQHRPVVYQEAGGGRQEVPAAFVVRGQDVSFALGGYEAGRPLVIDPVLSFSTYLGGSGGDVGTGIAVDPNTGDVLVTGDTNSTDFPTANALQPNLGGGDADAFVTRLRGDGSALIFSTYLGGSGADRGYGIAVDPNTGDVLITGQTGSTDFPTASPLQPNLGGYTTAFVTRLHGDGSALIFSTYLGGSGADIGYGIAVDPATGDVLITGFTISANFPTANALQPNFAGGDDAFVTRLSGDGSTLIFSTYLGGGETDYGTGIAVDPTTGDILITGITLSTDFPTANPLQPNYGGGFGDAFVTRLTGDGSALVFSTYLGGSSEDFGNGIAVDPTTGDVLITGNTFSTDFPTANPLQPNLRGMENAFVTRLSGDGSALVFSTYLGGSHIDSGLGIAVDPITGDVLITGKTYSTDFPTANPLQANNGGGSDAFVTRLRADGSALIFSTYLGGSHDDYGAGIAVDPITGNVLLTGETESTNFPIADALQPNYGGFDDAFVTRIAF